MVSGVFLARPNRFIAHVEIDGRGEVCHVKNTGRCRELLPAGAQVWCQESDNPARKTKYDLITVKKGERLINMGSSPMFCVEAKINPHPFGWGFILWWRQQDSNL